MWYLQLAPKKKKKKEPSLRDSDGLLYEKEDASSILVELMPLVEKNDRISKFVETPRKGFFVITGLAQFQQDNGSLWPSLVTTIYGR
jgi:hypothetical protein